MNPDARHDTWHDAVDARDRAFDGVFFVAITSTGIYCRPICPSRTALRKNRRFFETHVEAEAAGFRACLRCRPELAPGHTPLEVVQQRAQEAAAQIADGALNGASVQALAREMGVSERHLRRTVGRAIGASPMRVALAQRLTAATRMLAETRLSIARIAYDSGFQSLRRFNAAFREQYAMSPSAWRVARGSSDSRGRRS